MSVKFLSKERKEWINPSISLFRSKKTVNLGSDLAVFSRNKPKTANFYEKNVQNSAFFDEK